MARPRKVDLYVARNSFACDIDGEPFFIHKGEHVRAGHRLIRMNPDQFEPVDKTVHYDVEQTTAAPGEQRV